MINKINPDACKIDRVILDIESFEEISQIEQNRILNHFNKKISDINEEGYVLKRIQCVLTIARELNNEEILEKIKNDVSEQCKNFIFSCDDAYAKSKLRKPNQIEITKYIINKLLSLHFEHPDIINVSQYRSLKGMIRNNYIINALRFLDKRNLSIREELRKFMDSECILTVEKSIKFDTPATIHTLDIDIIKEGDNNECN